MSVALRTITRLQDADDINVSLGAGVDEYALCWDNDTARFVLRAPFDGTPYALLAGRAGGQTLYGGTAANDDITIHGTSDATRTTSYVILQPTAGNVGIGTASPSGKLEVAGVVISGSAAIAGEFRSCQPDNFPANYISLKTDTSIFASGLARYTGSALTGFFIYYNTSDGNTVINGVYPSVSSVVFQIEGAEKARIANSNGFFGIGITAPVTPLHAVSTTATTNALRNVLTLGANVTSTGVGAAGLGTGIVFQAESTTTVDTNQAAIEASWIVATHATRTSRLALKAYDTAEREGIRIDASGTAALLGFYGHAAAAQPSAYTPSNVSADRSFDADTVLVEELADVVGTLIADLQSIGLLA